jgi:N6-adenosine-specific RNA methylase IME4
MQKVPDRGRNTPGHTLADLQTLYAPFGTFGRHWDAIKKYVFECPDKTVHFASLDEAADKFAKVTDGLIKLSDRPAPTINQGDKVRGFDYTDGRKELVGTAAEVGDKTILLHNGKRIFLLGAILVEAGYQPTDKRGQQKHSVPTDNIAGFDRNDYSLIILDPPWQYQLRELDQSHRNRTPYPNMSDQEILDLPIAQIAAVDSYCLLWATANHLPLAFACLERWGFDYKAIHTWVKTTLDGNAIKFGVGHYGRNCTEFFLIGVKGNPGSFSSLGLTDIPTALHEAPTKHSAKPDKFYQFAHRLSNALAGETIELFARSSQPGWDLWGAEAPAATKSETLEVSQ